MIVSIIPNRQKDPEFHNTKQVLSLLRESGVNVRLPHDVAQELGEPYDTHAPIYYDVDVVVSLGGDGTLLGVTKNAAPFGTPVLGINLGQLGFLTEIERENLESSLCKLALKDYQIDERMMIEAELIREGKVICSDIALNDIGISRAALSRIVHFEIHIGGRYVENFASDGLLVSTPTGSTAYSLSAGGPIIDPSVSVVMITPICPHSLQARSMILPSDQIIEIKVEGYSHQSIMTVDGQMGYEVQQGDIIRVKKSALISKLVRVFPYDFYRILHNKIRTRGERP